MATFSFRSMNACRLCSNTLNACPSRKSTEQLPNCSGGSDGVILIFPCSRYRLISTSERTICPIVAEASADFAAKHYRCVARLCNREYIFDSRQKEAQWMSADLSRRRIMQAMGMAALATPASDAAAIPGPRVEGPDTPKICLEIGAGRLSAGGVDEAGMRRVKQLGVDHVLSGGPRIPWQEGQLRSMMNTLKSGGLALGNLMIAGFPNTISGRPDAMRRLRRSSNRFERLGARVCP